MIILMVLILGTFFSSDSLTFSLSVAPNGIMYVKPTVRKGLLGRMLVELLDTRVMVKQAMKRVGGDKVRIYQQE